MHTSRTSNIQNRLGARLPRVEYVNRAGEPVDPKTGIPYARPRTGGRGSIAAKVSRKEKRKQKRSNLLPVKIHGVMFGNLEPISTNPTIDPPPYCCFNCWQPGHSRNDCLRPVVSVYCNNCGRRGEELDTCPRCKRAYEHYIMDLEAGRTQANEHNDLTMYRNEMKDEEEILRVLIEEERKARELMDQRGKQFERNHEIEYQQENSLGKKSTPFKLEERRQHSDDREKRSNEYRNSYVSHDFEQEPLQVNEKNGDRFYENEIVTQEYERNRGSRYSESKQNNGRALLGNREYGAARNFDREPSARYASDKEYHSRSYYQDREYNDRSPVIENREHRAYPDEKEIENNPFHREYYDTDRASGRRESPPRASSICASNSADDPVQEIMQLAKSISHLSPETQDMIMRQVIAERKERARLRNSQEFNDNEAWQ